MVYSCSSFGCTNVKKSGSNTHFHQFPLNKPDVLKKWILAMGSKTFIPNEYSYLCSEHFSPDDYQIQPGSNEKLLLINAVPSIFKSFPEPFQNQEIGENSENDIYVNVHNTKNSMLKRVETKTYNYQNLTASSIVTCGNCKKQMNFKEYDTIHRSVHYNLCWLDGIQDKIDFFSTPKLKIPLRKTYNKIRSRRQLKCEWCNEIKLTISGLINHLKSCKYNMSEYTDHNNSVQCNIANLKKKQMRNKIKILQQNLKQRNAKIRLLKGLIVNKKKEILSSEEVTKTLTNNLEFSHKSSKQC